MPKFSIAVVRNWQLHDVRGHSGVMKAASLVKQVMAHVALTRLDNIDEQVLDDITVRHILTHTTGLPNWRDDGQPLTPLRPPDQRWGYSSEGFLLLQKFLEQRTSTPLDQLVEEDVFVPFAMADSRLDRPEPDFHGNRPLLTTAADYGRFLAQVLQLDDVRWQPLWPIDAELAWGAGWGLELGPPVLGWQWGLNVDASNFVIGCPATGDGVVVLTDDDDGRSFYRSVVEQELPGDHPSLRVEHNQVWIEHFL